MPVFICNKDALSSSAWDITTQQVSNFDILSRMQGSILAIIQLSARWVLFNYTRKKNSLIFLCFLYSSFCILLSTCYPFGYFLSICRKQRKICSFFFTIKLSFWSTIMDVIRHTYLAHGKKKKRMYECMCMYSCNCQLEHLT